MYQFLIFAYLFTSPETQTRADVMTLNSCTNRRLTTPLFCKHALSSSLECKIGTAVEPFREKYYNVKPTCHKIYQGRYGIICLLSLSKYLFSAAILSM